MNPQVTFMESARYQKVTAESTQSANLAIVTTEGDKVTLSTSLSSTVQTEDYHYQSYSPQSSSYSMTNAHSENVSTNRQFALGLAGDLNHREMHDVHKAFQAVDKTARHMAKGDMDKACDRLSKVDKLSSIAELTAVLSIQNSLEVETGSSAGLNVSI